MLVIHHQLTINQHFNLINSEVHHHQASSELRIQLLLRTQNTVLTGGELVILAPLEFGFDPDPDAPLIQGDKQTRCLIMEYESLGGMDKC